MLNYDKKYIYTWEIVNGKPLRPIVILIVEETGQTIGRPIPSHLRLNHVGFILGRDLTTAELIICSFTSLGVEITSLNKFLDNQKITIIFKEKHINIYNMLNRLQDFLKSPQSYCVGENNCYWFLYKTLYGQDRFCWYRNLLLGFIFFASLLIIIDK